MVGIQLLLVLLVTSWQHCSGNIADTDAMDKSPISNQDTDNEALKFLDDLDKLGLELSKVNTQKNSEVPGKVDHHSPGDSAGPGDKVKYSLEDKKKASLAACQTEDSPKQLFETEQCHQSQKPRVQEQQWWKNVYQYLKDKEEPTQSSIAALFPQIEVLKPNSLYEIVQTMFLFLLTIFVLCLFRQINLVDTVMRDLQTRLDNLERKREEARRNTPYLPRTPISPH